MKRLFIILIAVTTAHAQPNTVDQIKTKINEINQLLLATPEIKPMLDEQQHLYKQMIDIENKTGISKVSNETTKKEKEICLAKEKEVGPKIRSLQEKLDLLTNQFQKITEGAFDQSPLKQGFKEEEYFKFIDFMNQVKEKNAPLWQEIKTIQKELHDLERPYEEKKYDNTQYYLRKVAELGNKEYENIQIKVENLKTEIFEKLVQLKPPAHNLFMELAKFKQQLAKEKRCEWKEILGKLEKLSDLKSQYSWYI